MTLVVESMNATAPVEYDTTGSEPTVAPEPPASEYELHYSDVPFRGAAHYLCCRASASPKIASLERNPPRGRL